jgi:hypothetical protein
MYQEISSETSCEHLINSFILPTFYLIFVHFQPDPGQQDKKVVLLIVRPILPQANYIIGGGGEGEIYFYNYRIITTIMFNFGYFTQI